MRETYEFPQEFIWGASTAAHQIEGNNVASDWWAREHAECTDLSEPSGDAADSYHRYGEEIGRASCRKECRSRWSPYH